MNLKIAGIYQIKNLLTGQIYIGSSIKCIKTRWLYHKKDLKSNKHHSSKLQNSWNKYGELSFEISILEEVSSELCISKEQYYLDNLKPFFNICPTAGNCSGRKFSEETKKKMSKIKKGKPVNLALKKQQAKKIFENELGQLPCNTCKLYLNKEYFQKNRGKCKVCIKAAAPLPNPLLKSWRLKLSRGQKIIAKNHETEIGFYCLKDAQKYFRAIYPKFNKRSLKNKIISNESYYGFNWREV